MGSVTGWNPQHLIVYGAWLRNKDVPAAEARELCLKECPEDDPGLKNVERWLTRFADPKEPWIPPGGHLLTLLNEELVAKVMFNIVADTRDENRRLLKDLALAQELLEGKDKLLAEKTGLLEQAEAKVQELLAHAEKKPDLGISRLLEPGARPLLEVEGF